MKKKYNGGTTTYEVVAAKQIKGAFGLMSMLMD